MKHSSIWEANSRSAGQWIFNCYVTQSFTVVFETSHIWSYPEPAEHSAQSYMLFTEDLF
jgi:hypothetical protein